MSNALFILCYFSFFTTVFSLRLANHHSGLQESSLDEIPMHLNASLSWQLFNKDASPVKLLFFAGIEGSGHHLMEAVVKHLETKDKSKLKMLNTGFDTGFGNAGWGCGSQWSHTGIEQVVTAWKKLMPGLHILPQQMSYPMCGVGDHNGRAHKFYPHIDWMKEAADKAGVKLHILYFYRNVPDCLAADCIHRHFETCSFQTETLLYNGGELVKQLQTMPKSDYSCFHYSDVDSMRSAIEESFGAQYGNLIDVIYREHPSKDMQEKVEGWSNFESQLEKTDLEMREACSATNSISFSELLHHFT